METAKTYTTTYKGVNYTFRQGAPEKRFDMEFDVTLEDGSHVAATVDLYGHDGWHQDDGEIHIDGFILQTATLTLNEGTYQDAQGNEINLTALSFFGLFQASEILRAKVAEYTHEEAYERECYDDYERIAA